MLRLICGEVLRHEKRAMQLPEKVEVKGIRVLTSKQIAEEYGTSTDVIKKNFTRNREHFVEGKHYIALAGDELKCFKQNQMTNSHLVANRTAHLYLWTEKGALLHAKSINTDKTWQVYDYLVDFYFRPKKEKEMVGQVGAREKMENPKGIDIEPVFREIISALPVDSLDAMEKVFRLGNSKVIKIATTEILAEKMKRVMAEIK